MLELKVNGEYIDLSENAQITIEEESPVFDKDTIPGGFGYPFTLPVTDRNRRIFQFPERIEKRGSMTIEQDFELYHTGKLRLSGTITVTEADESYRAYLSIGSGNLSGKLEDKKLSDLDLGGERTWSWLAEYAYPESDFAIFPVRNTSLMLESTQETAFETELFRINAYESGAFIDSGSCFAVTPFPFLAYLIKKIFTEAGFQIIENCIESDSDLKDLVLYQTRDITSLVQSTEVIDVFLGLDPYGVELYEYQEVATVVRGINTFDLSDCLPDITIKEFLKDLRNRFNLAYVIDNQNRVKIIKRQDPVIQRAAIDITKKAAGDPQVISIIPSSGYALKWEHDEDDDRFAEENFKAIDDFLTFLKEPVANTTALSAIEPEINEIRLVESLGYYYRYAKYDMGGGSWRYQWQKWSIGFQNYLVGEMKEVFSSGLSTLEMVNWQRVISGPTIRLPWAEQKGNLTEREELQPFSPRLLFYRGLQEDSNGDPYPMGSNDNKDINGDPIPGKSLALVWEGESGVFNQLWKDYLIWWMNRKQVNWMILDASTLSFAQKYAIDRNHYLLKKRTIVFTLHEILPAECEFYLV